MKGCHWTERESVEGGQLRPEEEDVDVIREEKVMEQRKRPPEKKNFML